ncbi:CBN-CUL-6 protein [Caenorhabditis brenneri]|uniref:Cullin-1 n=1 Tax=Caenorhabditis brenneri TaxID=135651 RepID=G0P035_CAEBE|nr:CBN-CUL-6 protein [Caenorhabditis brenneri]
MAVPEEKITLESTWSKIQPGLVKVFRRDPMDPKEYMSLYSCVYNYCTAMSNSNLGPTDYSTNNGKAKDAAKPPPPPTGNTEFIGRDMYNRLEDFVSTTCKELCKKCAELNGEALLEFYRSEWLAFIFSAKVMDGICAYLNRHWIRREQDEGRPAVFMIYTMALVMWKRDLFDPLEKKIIDACLALIHADRNGEAINNGLIRAVTDSLVELGSEDTEVKTTATKADDLRKLVFYKSCFEERFLATTEEFYASEAKEFLGRPDASCTDYMIKVETRIQQEEDRVHQCLHMSTNVHQADVCNRTMINDQLEFIQSHFGPLLVEQKDDHLGRMYNLCCRIPKGLDALRTALERHVIKEGLAAMEKEAEKAFNDPKLYTMTLLEVQERYHGLVTKSFKQESGFIAALDRAAVNFVNANAVTKRAPPSTQANKSSELISRYCDQLFKKSAKMPDEDQMDVLQSRVIVIFKYLEDKDIFLKFYTKMFSKRLINELSASDEAEQSFISKLTTCCGFEYTSRLSKMVQDLQVSKDLTTEFKDKNESALSVGKKSIEFNSLVLSSGSWPNFPDCPLTLPHSLQDTISMFTTYYQSKFTGRRLQWCYSQCRGEVTCTAFKGKKYVFAVTTPQMVTLLLFNEQDKYTTEQIRMATGMDLKHTQMIVQSLITNLVIKSDKPIEGDNLPMDATLTLNNGYANKKVKVDLSRMTMKAEAVKDSEMVQKSADEDRKNVISAAIVRIMKMRKTFVHAQLISEVIDQLKGRFKPKVDMIKRCIGTLMEKEYIRRSAEQKDLYEYMA